MNSNNAKKRFFWLTVVLMLGTFFAGVTVTHIVFDKLLTGIGYFIVTIAFYLAAWFMLQRIDMRIEIIDKINEKEEEPVVGTEKDYL